MKSNNFTVYRSSAGSGKTYTLALSFVALSLKGNEFGFNNYYRRILAITFTNKAATEMKERVLLYFKELSIKSDKERILDWIIKETNLDKETIFIRSAIIYKHILHNYSDLSISTIDKFTYKIVRSFSSDIGVSQNFELVMDNMKIIQPVIAILLARIKKGGNELTEAIINFALQKIEDGRSSNIENDLEEFSQQIFKEDVINQIENKNISIKQCLKLQKKLREKQKEIEKNIQLLSTNAKEFFEINGLTKLHFKRGIFYKHFKVNLLHKDYKKWIPSETLQRYIQNEEWYSQGKPNEIKEQIDSNINTLQFMYDQLICLLKPYISNKAVLNNIYSIGLFNEILDGIKEYNNDNNIQHISSLNKHIHNIVVEQPSSFIYERIGERYNHFLIDEFQDTSLLQWQNILPLITDSIDYGKSLIVGDGKQSIYRWRSGEVEQFLKLPTIFKGDKLKYRKNWENKLKTHLRKKHLKNNFRSRKEIIKFNNIFFNKQKKILPDHLKDIYKSQEQDYSLAKNGGYVHLELFSDSEKDYKDEILNRMLDEIKKVTTMDNYCLKDIAILCNSKKRVTLAAEFLIKNNIDIVSNEGLLLDTSQEVKMLISCMHYLQDNENNIAKAAIIEYIHRKKLVKESLHKLNIALKNTISFNQVIKKAGLLLDIKKLTALSLYELTECLIYDLDIEYDIYIQFYLDMILEYSEKNNNSITEFLIWWEDAKKKESIVQPDEIDAVQIMTIHKAKGLAFNIVMIPFNWEDNSKKNKIWVNTGEYFEKLEQALINSSTSLKISYFTNDYINEKELLLLDNLNKLYVAMTRPKDRLYLFCKNFPKNIDTKFEKKGYLNSFLYNFSKSYPITLGNPTRKKKTKGEKKYEDYTIDGQIKNNWKEKNSSKKTNSRKYKISKHSRDIEWGKILHLALSKIDCKEDINKVTETFLRNKYCDKAQYEKLKEQLPILINNNRISKYINTDWEVKNEKEILLTSGKTYIPDKLIYKNNDIILIDYKTGEKKEEDKKQISNYADTLKVMGYNVIKTELIYTKEIIK